jgi:hypothetical protein
MMNNSVFMMPRFLSFFLFLIFIPMCIAFSVQQDVARDGYKGEVKSVEEKSFKIGVDSGDPDGQGMELAEHTLTTYDTNGRRSSITFYPIGESTEWIELPKYDANGRMLEVRGLDVNGNLITRKHFGYGKKGRLTTTRSYHYGYEDSLVDVEVYTYSRKGRVKEFRTRMITIQYKYDRKGNMVRISQKDGKEKKAPVLLNNYFVYNGDGKVIRSWVDDGVGKIMDSCTYVYDAQGREIEMLCYSAFGKVKEKKQTEYDEQGRVKHVISQDTDNGVMDFQFVYETDAKGNWTMLKVLSGNAVQSLTVRKITYYTSVRSNN